MKKSLSILLLVFALSSAQNSYAMEKIEQTVNYQPGILKSIWGGICDTKNAISTGIEKTDKFINNAKQNTKNALWKSRYLIALSVPFVAKFAWDHKVLPIILAGLWSYSKSHPTMVLYGLGSAASIAVVKYIENYRSKYDPNYQIQRAKKEVTKAKTGCLTTTTEELKNANNYDDIKRILAKVENDKRALDNDVNPKKTKSITETEEDLKKAHGNRPMTLIVKKQV